MVGAMARELHQLSQEHQQSSIGRRKRAREDMELLHETIKRTAREAIDTISVVHDQIFDAQSHYLDLERIATRDHDQAHVDILNRYVNRGREE